MKAAELAREVRSGGRALARALTVVERGGEAARALLAALGPVEPAHVVGVTGPPGAGKSTLVEAMGLELMARGVRPAVLAVDPSSPFTGGALLGDRLRMPRLAAREGVFVRSMATRGALGGLPAAAADAVRVLAAAGYRWVVVETVGTGQDEVEVMHLADTVVLTAPPGLGDEVQAAKAGVMEIAHVFAVTKADLPGAERVAAAIEAALDLAPAEGWRPPVVRVSAVSGEGIGELVDAVLRHRGHLDRTDGDGRAVARAARRLRRAVEALAWERVEAAAAPLAAAVAAGELDPYTAAERALAVGGTRLAHVAVAVRSIAGALPLYRALGLEPAGEEEVPEQGVRVAFLPAGGTRIELLEPLGEGSPVARHLERRGPGLHHVAVEVRSLDRAVERLLAEGYELVSGPAPGAHGTRVAFLHPRSTGGVLLELVEPAREGP